MRMDWVPVSAALLVTGALALALGSYLLPSSDGTAETVRVVQEQGGVWFAAAAVDFIAAVCLTLGLPAVLAVFDRRGRTLGLVGAVALAFGFLGTAGYAMMLVFFRALVVTHTIRKGGLEDVVHDAGLLAFLYAWFAGLLLGELLIGLGLLRARTTPRWVPLVLIAHVVLATSAVALPGWTDRVIVLLFVAGLAGIAVQVTSPAARAGVGVGGVGGAARARL
jgi:hypothetical protein